MNNSSSCLRKSGSSGCTEGILTIFWATEEESVGSFLLQGRLKERRGSTWASLFKKVERVHPDR